MTLEFRPPFSFNPNDETPSQRSLGNINQNINGLGQFAERYGQEQRQNRIQDAILALRKQQEDRDRMDWERQNTGTLPMQGDGRTGSVDMTPQGTSSWNQSPFDIGRQPFAQSPNYTQPQNPAPSGLAQAPFPQMASAGTPDTGWNTPQASPASFSGPQTPQPLHAPGADLTAHFNAWKQQGGGPYNHPEMSGMMSNSQNPTSQWNQYAAIPGSANRTEYRLFQDEARKQKEEEDRYGTGPRGDFSTLDQAAFQMSPNDRKKQQSLKLQLAQLYPDGKVPKSAITSTAGGMHFDITQGEHQSQFEDKRLTLLGDAIDPSKARAGAFGVSKQVFDRAERLESLAKAFASGNDLRDSEIEEMAIGLNAMLSGANTGAQAQVKALVPNTAWGNAQKLKQWLANAPQGMQQGQFVQRMLGSIGREKATASDQIKRTQMQRISRYADVEKNNPDGFAQVLQDNGIDPDEYHTWQKSGSKPISAVQQPDNSPGVDARGTGSQAQTVQRQGRDGKTYTYTLNLKTGKYE